MKINSRKFWAWVAWTIITVGILWRVPDSIGIALPLYGIITGAYMGIQGIIDAISKTKGH